MNEEITLLERHIVDNFTLIKRFSITRKGLFIARGRD